MATAVEFLPVKLPSIMCPDGRRAWAFVALFGAGIVATAIIFFVLWRLQNESDPLFWLAVLANGHVFVVVSSFGWVLGRRMLANVTRDGVTVDDRSEP